MRNAASKTPRNITAASRVSELFFLSVAQFDNFFCNTDTWEYMRICACVQNIAKLQKQKKKNVLFHFTLSWLQHVLRHVSVVKSWQYLLFIKSGNSTEVKSPFASVWFKEKETQTNVTNHSLDSQSYFLQTCHLTCDLVAVWEREGYSLCLCFLFPHLIIIVPLIYSPCYQHHSLSFSAPGCSVLETA